MIITPFFSTMPVQPKYVPPKKRVEDPLKALAPENFPCFGNGGGIRKSTLDFKQQILNAEEQRKKAQEVNTDAMSRDELIKDGWAILPLRSGVREVYTRHGEFGTALAEIDQFHELMGMKRPVDVRFDF